MSLENHTLKIVMEEKEKLCCPPDALYIVYVQSVEDMPERIHVTCAAMTDFTSVGYNDIRHFAFVFKDKEEASQMLEFLVSQGAEERKPIEWADEKKHYYLDTERK